MEKNPNLGESIVELKYIIDNMKMHHITGNHAWAIKMITRLKSIIDKIDIPELISEGETRIEA